VAGTTKPLAASFRTWVPAQRFRSRDARPVVPELLFEEPEDLPELQDVAPMTATAVVGAICCVRMVAVPGSCRLPRRPSPRHSHAM